MPHDPTEKVEIKKIPMKKLTKKRESTLTPNQIAGNPFNNIFEGLSIQNKKNII